MEKASIPEESNWRIKDILIRGGFINQHTNEQPEVEKTSSNFEYIEVEPAQQTSQNLFKISKK